MGATYVCASGGTIAAGRYVAPSWAPAAGELKTISKAAGFFGTNGGATLAEIDPNFQAWDPDPASNQPFGGASQPWATISAYCGMGLNTDTRQYFGYGAGHSAINVCAPHCFDLNDLRWKWLDQPLPFDGYQSVGAWTKANVDANYPGQVDSDWGEVIGDYTGFPEALRRPGIRQPIPCHSRAHIIHIPGSHYGNSKGAYFKCDMPTGITAGIDGTTISSHFFDFDTALWSRATNRPFNSSSSTNVRGVVHDPVSNKVVLFGGTFATSYYVLDVVTETWSTRTASASMTTCVDTGGHLLHEASGLMMMPVGRTAADAASEPTTGVKYEFWAVAMVAVVGSGSFAPSKLTISGSSFPLGPSTGRIEFIGWAYCPADKCLYAVGGWNGTNKYWKLTPPAGAVTTAEHLAGTWTLTEHTFTTGSFVTERTTNYMISQYNRLRWDVKSRAFIWHAGGTNDPVMAFRPHGV